MLRMEIKGKNFYMKIVITLQHRFLKTYNLISFIMFFVVFPKKGKKRKLLRQKEFFMRLLCGKFRKLRSQSRTLFPRKRDLRSSCCCLMMKQAAAADGWRCAEGRLKGVMVV